MMAETPLVIGGEEVGAEGGRTFDRRRPSDGRIATRAAAASPADARRAADAAEEAATDWSATGPHQRRALLLAAADQLESQREAISEAMQAEIGAAAGWAGFNLHLGAMMIREAAAMTTQIVGDVIPTERAGALALALREPAGPVLGIAPWNAPIILGVRAIAMPLACGNPVILKASERCPHTHFLIAQAFLKAGFPAGSVNFLSHTREDAGAVVEALIAHPAVRRINFTGSTTIGRIVAAKAAEHLKPVLLELGGKAPLIVLEDADLDEAVRAAAFGAFLNQGQICMSTERIIVVEPVADDFAERLAAKAHRLAAPAGEDSPLGLLSDPDSIAPLNALIEDAIGKGARLLSGGTARSVRMDPVVLDTVGPDMDLYREESFGPVVGIIRVRDEAEAIRVANDSRYGLSASVFTRDVARGLRVARRIRSGICHVNGPTVADEPQMPFGGVGDSGHGRFGGKAAIDFFTETRWVTIASEPGVYPF